ncbi:MAG: hypothetical protein HY791_15245 [Deltaproteobacteria bacterium]|nr:hypothetical protein [Deltaproteobacteria bacterium]
MNASRLVPIAAAAALATLAKLGTAHAETLVPGPSDPGFDQALLDKADAFVVQIHELLTLPIPFGLDAFVSRPEDQELINEFFAAKQTSFTRFAGRHPFDLIEQYDDYAHAAIFGGLQVAGDAFRYAVLRDQGAPEEQVSRARAIYLRNLDALDWFVRVTGVPGVVARGIRRTQSQAGEPPVPGALPELVPLFDESGAPLPKYKGPTWRADQSGELPFLIWLDDASRDTFDGYVFALGISYDVGAGDPTIPSEKLELLSQHARDIGRRLIETSEVADGVEIDLVLRDADGRPTTYHAFSAEEVLEGIVGVDGSNGFNAVMGLGMLRTLYHVSGDPELWDHYRDELVAKRDFFGVMERALKSTLYFGEMTNYSQVNMAFMAIYGLLRYENDPVLAARVRRILEAEVYDAGKDRDPRGLGQTFFDFIFAAFRSEGSTGIGREAIEEGFATLRGHPAPPYWDGWVENCDPMEIDSLECELVTGKKVRLSPRKGYGDRVVAVEPLPIEARPPSDFSWRSDPHAVNGGGKSRLNPGGDFHGAYWMGRFMKASTSGLENISPNARGAPTEEGCACRCGASGSGVSGSGAAWLVLGWAVSARVRRRKKLPPNQSCHHSPGTKKSATPATIR